MVSLAAVVAVLAASLSWVWLRGLAPTGIISVHWVVIAAGFALTEVFLVHFEHRREAHSVSFNAVPLVIGLYALSPISMITAGLFGSAAALVGYRRQAPIKVVVNLSSFGLAAVAAVLVFRALLPAGPMGVGTWPAAFVAAVVADQVQALVVTTAISLYQRRLEVLGGPELLGPVVSVVNAGYAIAAVTLLATQAAALALLGLAVPVLYASSRVHARLREQHRNLEQLYEFTRRVGESVVPGRVVGTLLSQVQELTHAEAAWLCVATTGGVVRVRADNDRDASPTQMPAGGIDDQLHGRAHLAGRPVLLSAADDPELAPALRAIGVRQAMVAPLTHVGDSPATVVVADRSGDVRDFNDDDLCLFATLVSHAAAALENDHLLERLREQAAASEHQSLHDALTGLPNRTMFGQRLTSALRTGTPLAVLLLDLDRFKEVNDTLGHHNGDALLQGAALRLRGAVRPRDMVARFGGDEFSILLTDLESVEHAVQVAHEMVGQLEIPLSVADVSVSIGASIGIAVSPAHGADAATLLRRADIAMYTAKADHSAVELYQPDRDEHTTDRLLLASQLRQAIERGELAVHFQPQLNLSEGAVIGAEALVRWNGDPAVRLPPAELVALAENTGLIKPLTRFVLEQATLQCRRWWAEGWKLRVSVNLSARNLLDPMVIDDVVGALEGAGLPTDALCIELTETTVMADPARTTAVLQELHDAGITISIDDFGTGYSSLAYLKRLPVDELKLDKSFVLGMEADQSDEVIVRSVIDLARNLGLPVVAEGIETEPARTRLRELGCEFGQGYLISRPLPADDFAAWLTGAAGTSLDVNLAVLE